MPTAKEGYWLRGVTKQDGPDDVRLPSVTQVIGRYKESGGLIHWAWREGKEGRDYKKSRDSAGSAGTLAHEMVRAWAIGLEDPIAFARTSTLEPEVVSRAIKGFDAFLEWTRASALSVISHETPLVCRCEGLLFGGTPDALGVLGAADGRLVLLDWKTGGVYSDVVLQLAAYRHLLNESMPTSEIRYVSEGHVIRLDKEWGSFSHRQLTAEQLDIGMLQFRDLLHCFGREKALKSMVK